MEPSAGALHLRLGPRCRGLRCGRCRAGRSVTLTGNINEGDDLFVVDLPLPTVREGDVVALLGVGSYNASLYSEHCLRPPAGAVFFRDPRVTPDLPVVHPWFGAEDAGDGVTRLIETHVDPFLESNVWHVRGSERDLVVDAANGIGPLRPVDRRAQRWPARRRRRHACALRSRRRPPRVRGSTCHRADAEMPTPAGLRLMREDFPAWLVEDFEYYDFPRP